jgi:hypothetical protein
LQTSAMNITWMCCARVISGFGTGHLNAIIPVWSSELAEHDGRGAILAFEVSGRWGPNLRWPGDRADQAVLPQYRGIGICVLAR